MLKMGGSVQSNRFGFYTSNDGVNWSELITDAQPVNGGVVYDITEYIGYDDEYEVIASNPTAVVS